MDPKVKRILAKLEDGRAFGMAGVTLSHTRVDGKRVSFATRMENDPIQRNHRRGTFYELKELRELKEHFAPGATFVDIGANVGNHTLYAALFLEAGKVISFEPNPVAYRVLIQNVLINRVEDIVDLTRLGYGLSDKREAGYAMQDKERNLGSAKMLPGKGDIETRPGDEFLKDETPAMIKVDVEGMELAALKGLEKTVKAHKPVLLVEVDNTNEEAFMAWVAKMGYRVENTVQRYKLNKNHLVLPA